MKTAAFKVMLVMTDLSELGAQQVVINLYNNFDRKLITPVLVLWTKQGKLASRLQSRENEIIYETDHSIMRPKLFWRLFRYLKLIWQIKPDVILSFVPATNVSIALLRMFIPKRVGFIASEHAFISKAFAASEYRGIFKIIYRLLLKCMYNDIADKLIIVANAAKKDAVENLGVKADKIQVIYNPQDLAMLKSQAEVKPEDMLLYKGNVKAFIAVGRLTKQKGFDSLLQAFAIVRSSLQVKLFIVGCGSLEIELKHLADKLAISKDVHFLGFRDNPISYIKAADSFVLSSIWEGMPMVLAEAMACATAVIAFDCPSGPREMLDDGKCGFLVADQDIQALADTMIYVLNNPQEAKDKARQGLEMVKSFEVKTIVNQYQALLYEIYKKRQEATNAI